MYLSHQANDNQDNTGYLTGCHPNIFQIYSDFGDKKELYDASIKQDNLSEVLAYAAIAVWVSDIVWTFVGTSELPRTGSARIEKGVSFGSGFDALTFTPTVHIRYNF